MTECKTRSLLVGSAGLGWFGGAIERGVARWECGAIFARP
jgi:hypothetical protein